MASAAATILVDSTDGLSLGIFLFLLAVCVLLLCYLIVALLKQGILGWTLALASGYGLLMLHALAGCTQSPRVVSATWGFGLGWHFSCSATLCSCWRRGLSLGL